ncbi:CynX/NimT family MFS transporter [Salana multivorans]|uniref:MFS transporter n=1 Tax=Salana multivorans TaxID=120377 RepID=UPI000A64233A|nr:MFS transporter [Salana multivorans]
MPLSPASGSLASRAVPAILRRPGAGGILAMIALSLALRAPLNAVPPVAGELGEALGVSAGAVGLLTSIPVLCFGLVTPASSLLLRVLGLRVSGAACLIGVVTGSVLRSGGSFALALVGTFLIGASLSIGNLVVPVLIGRVYPIRAAALMGVYSSVMNLGSTLATALTATLAVLLGWQLAIASWGVLIGGVALLGWLLLLPDAAVHGAPPPPGAATRPARGGFARTLRSPVAWLLAAAFAAQAMSWYAITAWLPSALEEMLGMSTQAAGLGASAFQVSGIVGPILVPAFLAASRRRSGPATGTGRPRSQRDEAVLVLALVACWAAMPLGMLLAPGWWLVWALVAGVGQGGFFTTIFLLAVRRTGSDDENRRTATLVQTFGYLAAASAPVLVGAVHERVAGWTVLFGMVGVLVVVMGIGALGAALRPMTAHVDAAGVTGDGSTVDVVTGDGEDGGRDARRDG